MESMLPRELMAWCHTMNTLILIVNMTTPTACGLFMVLFLCVIINNYILPVLFPDS